MSANKPVVVYGASGYTGRLVCEYLREFDVPFVAAGRDKTGCRRSSSGCRASRCAHDVVEVEHDVAALTELFTGATTVCNMVGPFIKYGGEVVQAALAAGCHYVDTTGEQDWVISRRPSGASSSPQGPTARARRRAHVHHR